MQPATTNLNVLFVHGMGRSPLSGWPMLRRLRRAGMTTHTFGYMTSLEDFARIRARLIARIVALAGTGDYIVVGHSLGGVLLRAAINALPAATPRPRHLYLLGVPQIPARLAITLANNIVFRLTTGDCGELLASSTRMAEIGAVTIPTTSIIGVRGWHGVRSPFGHEPNDCVVAVSEARDTWITEEVQIPCVHTWLPASRRVAEIIVARHQSAQTPRGY